MVPLNAPCATPPKLINFKECILCQKKKSEYLCSGEHGRQVILSLAQQAESEDTRAARVLKLTVQEQGIMKYHNSSCYRLFQFDMKKTGSITQPSEQPEPSQQQVSIDAPFERRSKRKKSSVTKHVCIICGAATTTVKQKKIHKLFRICEKPMAQKLLNAAMLFQDHVYTETSTMSEVGHVFAADIMIIVVKTI